MTYLDSWEKSVSQRKGFDKKEKEMMLLSRQTREGLRLTGKFYNHAYACSLFLFSLVVNAFVELIEYLFRIPDVSVFLSNRICQDPLENFFGVQRQRGRVNENPSAPEVYKNTQAIRVIDSACTTVKGNCRGNSRGKRKLFEVDNTALKKRKVNHK